MIISQKTVQSRLVVIAGVVVTLYSLLLTLAPVIRLQSWKVDLNWIHWLGWIIWIATVFAIHKFSFKFLTEHDPFLLPIAMLLTGIGLLTIYRLFPEFGIRQSIWLIFAFLIFIVIIQLPNDLSYLRKYKYLWLTAGLIITGLTLILGTNPSGSAGPRLWLGCCGFYFQPAEPLKFLLILYLAAYLSDKVIFHTDHKKNSIFKSPLLPLIAPTLLMTGLALSILVIQRDLGTAAIFLVLFSAIAFIATNEKKIILISLISLLVAGLLGFFLFDVVQIRLLAWIDPWRDPTGGSYQIIQALIALARGEFMGRGPGLGNPGLVPVPHSDFIFSSIVEETGLIGAISILLALALFTGRGFLIAINAPGVFRRLLAVGLTVFLVGQSILIIGGNIRLFPLTGVTLPFVSYGGSSLIVSFLCLGLLLVISNSGQQKPSPLTNPRSYLLVAGFLLTGLLITGLLISWWSIIQRDALFYNF